MSRPLISIYDISQLLNLIELTTDIEENLTVDDLVPIKEKAIDWYLMNITDGVNNENSEVLKDVSVSRKQTRFCEQHSITEDELEDDPHWQTLFRIEYPEALS